MARVAILGAGDMGTALAVPLARNGHDVRLWGTPLDTAIVDALRAGAPHPRLRVVLPTTVAVYPADRGDAALDGAEIVVVAVTSDAVRKALPPLAQGLAGARALVTVAKGLDRDDAGSIRLLPDIIAGSYRGPIVGVGGPSKANEVAFEQPTQVVYASVIATAVALCRDTFRTPAYDVRTSSDIVGVEVAAAMKNAYAIALGVADGLERRTGKPYHNLRAALFPRAVQEMAVLAEALGGRMQTAAGLAGCGDLQVTIASGRNRLLGERIGLGEPAAAAAQQLAAAGTTVEGYLAADLGYRLVSELAADGLLTEAQFPLLAGIWRMLYAEAPAEETLWAAAKA